MTIHIHQIPMLNKYQIQFHEFGTDGTKTLFTSVISRREYGELLQTINNQDFNIIEK